MTDNTIDMTGRLPPEVRKPWRDELPEGYAKHIDDLLALPSEIRAMRRRLEEIRDAIGGDRTSTDVRVAVNQLSKAVVLLECAEEQATYTVPTPNLWTRRASDNSGNNKLQMGGPRR